MANITFNIAKGKVNAYHELAASNDASALVIVLLKDTDEGDAGLKDHESIAGVLGAANTEANFTGYDAGRKTLTDTQLAAPVVNHSTDIQSSATPTVTWASAGGTLDNALIRCIICYVANIANVATNNLLIPLTAHDLSVTTNGNNLNLNAGIYVNAS